MDLINKIGRVYRSQRNRLLMKIAGHISPDAVVNVNYMAAMGHFPNMENPQDWCEKIIWLNRNWITKDKVRCTDKIQMHDYLREKGVPELSVKLLGTWSRGEDIDFDALPERFVLKCNHGCGFNIIVKDKLKLNRQEAIDKLNKWLTIDYSKLYGERHYHYVEPRILAEEYLEQLDSNDIIDYKLHCFNGKPHSFFVCRNRNIGKVLFSGYSLCWERNRFEYIIDNQIITPPLFLNSMLRYAELLSKDFPYVRLDFYEIENKLYLGEFTFTPAAGGMFYYTKETILNVGKDLVLPQAQNDFVKK